MNKEAKKTDQLIQIYKEDPVKENLKALVHQVQKTTFMVPAMMPKDVDMEEIKKTARESGGGPLQMPEGARPVPCILTNKEGLTFFPIYTSQTQIPREPKYDVLMNMPFKSCYTLALNPKLGAQGIAINPFTDNLLFKKELLEAIQKEEAALASGAKQIQISPQQFKVMMRQKAEFHDFPFRVFQEGAPFIQKLSDEKEVLVNEIYQKAYQKPELYPYRESDFSVMPLNISDELLLIRVDLPEIKAAAQLCYRVYVTLNPKTDEAHYFMIERGKEKGVKNLCGVDSEGKHVEYGEAPVEGAEIQRVMDLLKQEKEKTS